jgi:NADH-quinone oxidoreductase subunit K
MDFSVQHIIVVAALLFLIGLIGVLFRRHLVIILISFQLMSLGAILTFVSYARLWGDVNGQVFAFIILLASAAQLAVGLAIITRLYRQRGVAGIDEFDSLREDL